MKLNIKPEQVYIVVFCFFAVGAGCKAAGKYAIEKLDGSSASNVPVVETASPEAERKQFRVVEHPDGVHLEELTATPVKEVDIPAVEG